MPAQKKPADKLQRRNKPKQTDAQIVAINTADVPTPPVMSRRLQGEWKSLWQSDLAASWNKDSDLIAMRRLFGLYDRLAKYEKAVGSESVVAGSTGQPRLHPLLAEANTIRSQILALEDRFGMTPLARLKLGIALGEAQQSIQQMNDRLAAAADDSDDEEEIDPRVTIIDTTGR